MKNESKFVSVIGLVIRIEIFSIYDLQVHFVAVCQIMCGGCMEMQTDRCWDVQKKAAQYEQRLPV